VSPRYLIRLDDASATMHRERWAQFEAVLDRHAVKPIVAVIPDNRDPTLTFAGAETGFWERVRAWIAKDWTVGMHGYTHVMHPTHSKLVLPFYPRSEFAGLPLEAQAQRIRAGWQLFRAQDIEPTLWIAPAHSFDLATLAAVRAETSMRVVSDGIGWDTWYEHGFYWIPQQLWGLRERSSGLWTVCLHPNTMDAAAIAALDRDIGRFRSRIVDVADVALRQRRKSLRSRLYHTYFWWCQRRALSALS